MHFFYATFRMEDFQGNAAIPRFPSSTFKSGGANPQNLV
jgi:hypothetical protein